MSVPTPHIEAKKEDIAKIVFMSGDPLRAKFFAETFLKNAKQINSVRGMLGFTGTYEGKKITVMGHGMGLDSIGIYAYELYKFYDVETIIRFGSCGSYNKDINLFDLIIAEKAFSESNYGLGYGNKKNIINANEELVNIAKEEVEKLNLKKKYFVTTVNSSMWFYQTHNEKKPEFFIKKGIDVVEMEAYSLYSIANALNKKALVLLTVSDSIVKEEFTTSEERRIGFKDMFNLLLEILKKI